MNPVTYLLTLTTITTSDNHSIISFISNTLTYADIQKKIFQAESKKSKHSADLYNSPNLHINT